VTPEIENKVGGDDPHRGSSLEVLRVFFKLGVSSFGGPIAHIGYFHEEFVVRRRWLSEQAFVDLVALCQFLPGPASSQTGFPIGLRDVPLFVEHCEAVATRLMLSCVGLASKHAAG
jgi:Chromate transporter